MDRKYKEQHLVKVFANAEAELADTPIETLLQAPYSVYGYENYKYQGVMYKGYRDPDGDPSKAYILLSDLAYY